MSQYGNVRERPHTLPHPLEELRLLATTVPLSRKRIECAAFSIGRWRTAASPGFRRRANDGSLAGGVIRLVGPDSKRAVPQSRLLGSTPQSSRARVRDPLGVSAAAPSFAAYAR
jgi:hypothetical protein